MKLYRDPRPEQIEQIFAASQHNAAKWLKVPDGTLYCWAAEEAQHAFVARLVNADVYDKGLMVPNDPTPPPA